MSNDAIVLEDQDGDTAFPSNIDTTPKGGKSPREMQQSTIEVLEQSLTRIVLEENDNIPPTGLPVSVNGKAWLIQPGHEVSVPDEVLEVLNNATMSTPVQDPQTQQITGWRDRLRYPYRILTKRQYNN